MPLRQPQSPTRRPGERPSDHHGEPTGKRSTDGAARRLRSRVSTSAAGANAHADVCEIACVDQAKVARVRQAAPDGATLTTLAETFRALGDPTRLLIVTALAREELCVCDLATLVGVSQSAVSHSLRTLRQLRLVRYRKVGKIAYYTLDDAHVAGLVTEGVRHVEERAPQRAPLHAPTSDAGTAG